MVSKQEAEQNEYEAQRLANIAKNQALLRELQLNAASAGLGIPKSNGGRSSTGTTTNRSHRKKTDPRAPAKKQTVEVVPRRTSSRLAGLQADSEVAKRKAEEEHAAIQQVARLKRQRVSGDVDLRNILVTGHEWDDSKNFLADITRTGNKYERTFTDADVSQTGDKQLKALREKMSTLKLYEEFEPNSMFHVFGSGMHSSSLPPSPRGWQHHWVLVGSLSGNLSGTVEW